MDDVDTPTQVEVPTPTEVAEAPRTEAAPEATPAQESVPEAEATETKLEETPEPPKTPWADKSDFYDVLELDEAKPFLERRDRRIDAEARENYQRQYEEATGNWKATEAYKQLAGISGTIIEKLGQGDADTVGKLIGRMEQMVAPFEEDYKKGLRAEGSSEAATQLYGAVLGSLDHRGQDELQDYLTVNRGAKWGDILKKRDEIREGKTKKSSSDEITSLKAQIEDLKAKARPDGPDTTQKGGGGSGKSPAEAWAEAGFPESGPLKEAYRASQGSEAI